MLFNVCTTYNTNCVTETSKDNGLHKPIEPPALPTGTCCMSGCVNCVWIKHAEELINFYKGSEGKAKALKLVDAQVEDESLKAYLKFEIRMMK